MELQRSLSNRHVQLIAIGGAIGTGLFMGSGKTISTAGPSVLLVYAIIGFVLFFIMRAMGELLLSREGYHTFSDFIADILGPTAGFVVGWTYWLCWIVTATAEVIAVAGYTHFWWPNLPLWIPALIMVGIIFLLNSLTVKAFGETEFWFSLVKIVAIVALIVMGCVLAFSHFTSPNGIQSGVSNLWLDSKGNIDIFPHGITGFFGGFQLAIFSFIGIELVGTTAGEAKDPEITLPKAINSIPLRILMFYILALGTIMMVTPWNEVDPELSPFVNLFSLVGITAAASVVNFVVITSAASSCNSGVYSTSRMAYSLARNGQAPAGLAKLSGRFIPEKSLMISCAILLTSIPLMETGGTIMEVFTMVTSVSSLLFIFVWVMIVWAYLVYRLRRPAEHDASTFKLPGGKISAILVLVFVAVLIIILAQDFLTLMAIIFSIVWVGAIWIAATCVLRKGVGARVAAKHKAKVQAEYEEAVKYRASISRLTQRH
ncbi:amino acid permease [Arcanobacterium canis]